MIIFFMLNARHLMETLLFCICTHLLPLLCVSIQINQNSPLHFSAALCLSDKKHGEYDLIWRNVYFFII